MGKFFVTKVGKVCAVTVLGFGVVGLVGGCVTFQGWGEEPVMETVAVPPQSGGVENVNESGGADFVEQKWANSVEVDVPRPEFVEPSGEYYVYDDAKVFIVLEENYPNTLLEYYLTELDSIPNSERIDSSDNDESFQTHIYQVSNTIVEIVVSPLIEDDDSRSNTTAFTYRNIPSTFGSE